MNPRVIIAENTSGNAHWRSGCFVDALHETRHWDVSEYWRLEWSLYAICADHAPDSPTTDIFRIFSYVMQSFACHFDPNDGFVITNLSADELNSFRERFQLVFEGYFCSSMPPPTIFESVNPLLSS